MQKNHEESQIWLRYTTQITAAGRTQTIEMSVPIPLGATADERERLLEEAEAGLEQLISHTTQQIPQMIQRTLQGGVTLSTTSRPNPAPSMPAQPTRRPASLPAPLTAAQPVTQSQIREAAVEGPAKRHDIGRSEEPARNTGGLSLPSTPGNSGDGRATMTIPEFLQQVRENLNLNSTQAMKLLNVKVLSGINLREAYERLVYLVAKDTQETQILSAPSTVSQPEAQPAEQSKRPELPPELKSSFRQASALPSPVKPIVIETQDNENEEDDEDDEEYYVRPTGFDEEEDEDGEEDSGASARLREQAYAVIERLREVRGVTIANPTRQTVLRNVIGGQLEAEQLQQLIDDLWGVTTVKKLKVDQVEALISWAKTDDFMSEAEVVLQLLEEEHYARGNR
jgi:hypothetical protein